VCRVINPRRVKQRRLACASGFVLDRDKMTEEFFLAARSDSPYSQSSKRFRHYLDCELFVNNFLLKKNVSEFKKIMARQ